MGKSASAKVWNAVFISKIGDDCLDDEPEMPPEMPPAKPSRTKKKPEVYYTRGYFALAYN